MSVATAAIDSAATVLKAAVETVKCEVNNQRADVAHLLREEEGPDAPEKQMARHLIAEIDAAQPERWIAIANTHFQEGLMALRRAVDKPTHY